MTTRLDRLRSAMALAIDDHPVILDTSDIRAALAVCDQAARRYRDRRGDESECQCEECVTVRALLAEADTQPEERAEELRRAGQ